MDLQEFEGIPLDDVKSQKRLKSKLRKAFKTRSFQEWIEIFQKIDACVEPVLKPSEAANHPQLREREMIGKVLNETEIPSGKLLHPFDFRRLLWYLVLRAVNWEQTPFPCSGNWVGMMNASAPFSNPEPAGIFLKRIVIIEKEGAD